MLDSRPDDFDDRNFFFWACLGLLSASRRLDDALAADIPEGAEEAELTDPGLLAVLGAVAFRLRLGRALAGVPDSRSSLSGEPARDAGVAAAGHADRSRRGVPGLREILR